MLDDLNLVIRPGSASALVGRSGAGKSTLVNLLLRFHDLEQGSIRIDGVEVREVTQESLRAAIGMVTQDTSLLHRSIAANIGYGRPGATMAEIVAAAKQGAGARVHRRPAGLEGPHRLRRRTSANAASSSPADSASASPSRA